MSYLGMGSYYPLEGFGAFGGIDFEPQTVWTDWLAGASGNNAAGARAAKAIQAALSQAGFGPITVDGQFGSGSVHAWNLFAAANGVAANWPTQAGVIKLGELVNQGAGTVGTGPITEYHVVGGQYVAGKAPGTPGGPPPAAKAGMSTGMMIGIGALAAVGIGVAVMAGKKKKAAAPASGPAKAIPNPFRASFA